MKTRWLVTVTVALPLFLAGGRAFAASKAESGVYEYVLEGARGPVDEAARSLEAAFASAGWRVLARVEAGVPEGCGFRAEVLAVVDMSYARRLMTANRKTGPFAVVDRVNVFEDEAGVHVALLNAESINRTVLMDDDAYAAVSREHVDALRALVTATVAGRVTDREFGEKRSRGYIGKTMGVMAGGPFVDKVKDEVAVDSGDWRSVADKVRAGLSRPAGKWGLHLVYELALPEQQTVILGTSGSAVESKSFSIVGAGTDDARDSFRCPGLAHAAAYPIEVVVTQEGGGVRVRLADVMYRMKMFFEDAGKWAFMKNMGMPGSIHDEIAAQIRSGLVTQ